MNEKNLIQEGAEFIGRLEVGGAIRDAGKAAAEVGHEFGKYVEEHVSPETQALERARGELAQARAAGVQKSDELLDIGLPGLRFFDNFLPLYNEWTNSNLDLQKEIYDQYHQLYGIDFAAMRRDAKSLANAGIALHSASTEVQSEFESLASTWEGNASIAATNHVFQFLETSNDFKEKVDVLQRNTERHSEAMESIIQLCARSALDLHSVACGGQMPPTIEQLIAAARRQSGIAFNDLMGTVVDNAGGLLKLGSALPVVGSIVGPTVDELTRRSKEAEATLDNVFVPAFEAKLKKFQGDICKKTQDDLRDLWSAFKESSESVPRSPFSHIPLLF